MALKGSIEPPAGRVAVTVVIPARNAAATIERAVRSAFADGLPEVEVIVVDDASDDATATIAEGIAAGIGETGGRVRVLRMPAHGGVSVARNAALDAAAGTWLTFLDADDRLLPGGLASMVAVAGRAGTLAVVGQRIWTDGRWSWRAASYDIPDIRRAGRTSLVARPGLLYYASATGKLFDRSLLDGLRFEGSVLGDQPWTIRALLRAGDAIEVIETDVYEWSRPRRGVASSSITATKRGSARLAAEAARRASGALAEVAAEAETRIADPGARGRLVETYFERLVRADLAGPVRRAVARGDDGSDELFEAVEAFLASAPADLVAAPRASAAIATEILRPPLEGWSRLAPRARDAYVRLLRASLARDPRLERVLTSGTMLGPGVSALGRAEIDVSSPDVARLLARQRPLAAIGEVIRLGGLGLRRLRTMRPARP